jgi:hypothetical protein
METWLAEVIMARVSEERSKSFGSFLILLIMFLKSFGLICHREEQPQWFDKLTTGRGGLP